MARSIYREVARELRERLESLRPTLMDALGVEPQRPAPQVSPLDAFLSMTPEGRQALLSSVPPEQYRAFTARMMREIASRYGSEAAELLVPLFQREAIARSFEGLRLPALIGEDPFAGTLYTPEEP